MNTEQRHIPVLQDEVLATLSPNSGDRILDVTLGLGGHSTLLLEHAGSGTRLVALDADEQNLEDARKHLSEYKDQCTFVHANFSDLDRLQLGMFDIIFADLGVSSPHFDDAERGFSFRNDGPLDMRLDRSKGVSAAQWIEEASEQELSLVLRDLGELKQNKKLAASICQKKPKTTKGLFEAIEDVVTFKATSVAPQVFQAIRMHINQELEALENLLDIAPRMLNPNGRFGVIAFHSLEDRMVKKKFRTLTTAEIDEHTGQDIAPAPFGEIQRKAIKPSQEEMQRNPRARSARLRVVQKR